jgi:hypothetical protein
MSAETATVIDRRHNRRLDGPGERSAAEDSDHYNSRFAFGRLFTTSS